MFIRAINAHSLSLVLPKTFLTQTEQYLAALPLVPPLIIRSRPLWLLFLVFTCIFLKGVYKDLLFFIFILFFFTEL